MGASAALRFARHATDAVVALVPQVDLRDFSSAGLCDRVDFDDARKARHLLLLATSVRGRVRIASLRQRRREESPSRRRRRAQRCGCATRSCARAATTARP
jgi:hypothetical protein